MPWIHVEQARTHNLKNISLSIPRGALTVVTGVSGSGKSSLAFDTLFAEGQRRYVESLSAYARQFLDLMPRPDVQSITGLSPAIAIDQQGAGNNPRSTVGTITELADYLRLLFARLGVPTCPEHGLALKAESIHHMTERLLNHYRDQRVIIGAPLLKDFVGNATTIIQQVLQQGYIRFSIDGVIETIDHPPTLDDGKPHTVWVVVDRIKLTRDHTTRLADSLEKASQLGEGRLRVWGHDDASIDEWLTTEYACPLCNFKVPALTPAHFSANNPQGACPTCHGTGISSSFDPKKIVAAPFLSLKAGAIPGWDARNPKKLASLEPLVVAEGFSLDTPWDQLPKTLQDTLMYGDPEHQHAGFIPQLEALYHDPEQPHWQDALANLRSDITCPDCHGHRLAAPWQAVRIGSGDTTYTWPDLEDLPIHALRQALENLEFLPSQRAVSDKLIQAMISRLTFLMDVGLPYLTLSRRMDTLSGGEAQRIRLASQLGAGLTGVLYVLDEPSIGLHPRDNTQLIQTLKALRDQGNTLVVVEHDEDTIREADFVVDMGPGAGVLGGEVVASGTPGEIIENPKSLTGQYLRGEKPRPTRPCERTPQGWLTLTGATGHNLHGETLKIPLGMLTAITGVSGSGKSSLIMQTLYPLLAQHFHRAQSEPLPYESWHCDGVLKKVIHVDQKPIGRTPRSNPATYTGLMTPLRELFANTTMARERGYGVNRFSFNVKGGRCEACQGDGMVKMSMHFLPDVFIPCDACHGKRYNHETLEVQYKGHSMADVLNLTVTEALELFTSYPKIMRILEALNSVGLGYLSLGQSATTLSGGEAQRLKLATELARPTHEPTLFILDEPTTGLHFDDIDKLYHTLQALLDQGHTVVMIEHHTDMIAASDWMIDMGPEGGEAGGHICFEGRPEEARQHPQSLTGRYLCQHA